MNVKGNFYADASPDVRKSPASLRTAAGAPPAPGDTPHKPQTGRLSGRIPPALPTATLDLPAFPG